MEKNGMKNWTASVPQNIPLLEELSKIVFSKHLSSLCGESTNQLEIGVFNPLSPMSHIMITHTSIPYLKDSVTPMVLNQSGLLLTPYSVYFSIGLTD